MKRLTRFFAAALIISGFTLAPVADSEAWFNMGGPWNNGGGNNWGGNNMPWGGGGNNWGGNNMPWNGGYGGNNWGGNNMPWNGGYGGNRYYGGGQPNYGYNAPYYGGGQPNYGNNAPYYGGYPNYGGQGDAPAPAADPAQYPAVTPVD